MLPALEDNTRLNTAIAVEEISEIGFDVLITFQLKKHDLRIFLGSDDCWIRPGQDFQNVRALSEIIEYSAAFNEDFEVTGFQIRTTG